MLKSMVDERAIRARGQGARTEAEPGLWRGGATQRSGSRAAQALAIQVLQCTWVLDPVGVVKF